MGGSSGPSGSTTTTSNAVAEPPAYAQPYVKQGLEGARLQYESSSPQFFPGATFVPASSETETGLAGITGEALRGSPIEAAGRQEYLDTLSGKYLDPTSNPHFAGMVEGIKANVLPGLDSRFISSGRTGSGLHGRAVGEGVGSAVGQLAYNNYEAERARQAAAANNAPAYAATRFADYDRLLAAGGAREAYAGDQLQDEIARFDFGQNVGQKKVTDYLGNIGQGVFGSNTSQTQTTPYFRGGSTASGALGGAATGASLGAAAGPYGALIGAGVGAAGGAASSK